MRNPIIAAQTGEIKEGGTEIRGSANALTQKNLDGSIWFTYNHGEPEKATIMSAFTVRVSDDTAKRLDQLAEKQDRSRSYMAAKAIEDFVAREEWQLAEIEAGLGEAESGKFASADEVAQVIARYVQPARQP